MIANSPKHALLPKMCPCTNFFDCRRMINEMLDFTS